MDITYLQPTSASPAWYKALGVSLLLHAAVVVLLLALHSRQGPLQARPEPEQASLALFLVTQNPQLKKTEIIVETEEQALAEALEDTPQVDEWDTGNEPATEPVHAIRGLVDSGPTATVQAGDDLLADLPENTAEDEADSSASTVSSGTVREMISAYTRDRSAQHTEDWLAACLIYRKEHGTSECPAQQAQDYSGREQVQEAARHAFASVTRPQQQRRLTKDFIAQSKVLLPLMKGSGLLVDLAVERAHLNSQNIAYLTGNFDYKIADFVQAWLSSHSFNGNGNAAFIRNMFQPVCSPMPCIREYTGFSIERPEPEPQGSENEFRVSASLFGNSQ